MMNILIVDDEPLARSRLRRLLAECAVNAVVTEAASAEQARQLAASLQPDLVLLDISMPGESGLQLAEAFASSALPPALIFVTAYPEHALAAFNVHPVDYLLKPISLSQLQRSLQRAGQLNRLQKNPPDLPQVSYQQAGLPKSVPLAEVRFFAAEDKYVRMQLAEQHILLDKSLNQLEEAYPQLLRIHRKTLINPQYLTAIRQPATGPAMAELEQGKHKLAISRRVLSAVKHSLQSKEGIQS
ncbi:LytTR family DNA-binding domain-containing protein [Alishewanella sp. WH16-1]|uniref:LytR/AlgR family response regulator transcription factor n=1 Tax=Alishewanella sp. WH16-1 TaxID=1651088 RepID=UPI000A4B4CF7|nr:LytTR family DNA-binding domain-containing protein [Alishewanella sp. WH16-1]